MPTRPRLRRRTGFTLIEVLVATGISVILVLGVVQIATASLKAYDNAVAMVSATATARTVLDSLESDLQGVIIRPDNNVWLEAGHTPNTAAEPGALSTLGNTRLGADHGLFFFSTPTDRDRFRPGTGRSPYKGDVCAVRYRLLLRNPLPDGAQGFIQNGATAQDKSYVLTRTVVNAEDTFNNVLPLIIDPAKTGPASEYWTRARGTGTFVDQKAAAPDKYYATDILATNVIALVPTFIFKNTTTAPGSTTGGVRHAHFQTPQSQYENAAQHLALAGSKAYTLPNDPNAAPSQAANSYRDTGTGGIKVADGWYAKNRPNDANATLAARTDTDGATKGLGTLSSIIISLVVLDDAGADKVRALQNQTGQTKLEARDWDPIYAEHAHTFTRRINLPGR